VLSNYTQARLHAQRCLLRQACRTCAWSRPPLQHVCTQCSCTAKRLAGLQLRVARAQTWRARAARARGPQVSACLERISRVSRVSRVWGRRAGAAGALGLRRLPCLAAGQPVHGRAARGQRRAARRAECAAAARPLDIPCPCLPCHCALPCLSFGHAPAVSHPEQGRLHSCKLAGAQCPGFGGPKTPSRNA